MKQRNSVAILALAIILMITGALDLSAQFRRRDITTFTAAERLELRQLIMTWMTSSSPSPWVQHLAVIGNPPTGVHCNTATFLTWHRTFIEQLEAWLMAQNNGPKYVPLPKWNPATPIPDEFFNDDVGPGSAVAAGFAELEKKDPNSDAANPYNFSPFTNPGTVCSYTSGTRLRVCMGGGSSSTFGTALDNFALALERVHNNVHIDIGGIMDDGRSPGAAIFHLWHAFVDDAYQYYLCRCTTSYPNKDVFIKDNNADIGAEPNTTTTTYYQSPEIWVRRNADVFNAVTGRYSMEDNPGRHQTAEYKTSGNNYVYVRVRNKGCQATTATEMRLRVYWSKAQTSGWVWPNDWTNTPPQVPKRGDEITNPGTPLLVPALQPGQSWVAQIPWQPPNPASYPNDSYHFCLLARIVSVTDPMAVVEGADVNANTRNNNNIAWKNVTVKDDDPFNIIAPGGRPWNTVHVRAAAPAGAFARLGFDFPANHGVNATIELRDELYTRWNASGQLGYGVTNLGGGYVRIDAPGAYVEGIYLDPGEIYTLGVLPYVEYGHGYGGTVMNYGEKVDFNVTQYESSGATGPYAVTGGNNYEIRLEQSEETDCGSFIGNTFIGHASCPNVPNGYITTSLIPNNPEYFWSNGARTPSISGLAAGNYWVVVRKADGCIERREFEIKDLSGLDASMISQNPRCRDNNGSATVTVSGGLPPYTYQWYKGGLPISGATTPSLAGMGFGDYHVVATDDNSCSITKSIGFADHFMQVDLVYAITDASSPLSADGAIDLTVINGMPPYTIQWSNGATTEDLTSLAPGDYSVLLIDNMGCVASGTVTVNVAPPAKNVGSGSVESDLSILNVVPNPVTDLAEVVYSLSYATNVMVEVYDELGKLVSSYDQGVKQAGENSVWLPTATLPNGRYQCRLVHRGGVSAIPFVVVR